MQIADFCAMLSYVMPGCAIIIIIVPGNGFKPLVLTPLTNLHTLLNLRSLIFCLTPFGWLQT